MQESTRVRNHEEVARRSRGDGLVAVHARVVLQTERERPGGRAKERATYVYIYIYEYLYIHKKKERESEIAKGVKLRRT